MVCLCPYRDGIYCFLCLFRCFTFGIGSGASTELVEGLATAGMGSVEFVKEGERLQPKVSYYCNQIILAITIH